MARLFPRPVLALLFVVPVGCGDAAQRARSTNDLKELGLTYHKFVLTEGRPPKSYAELNQKYPMSPGCERATVYWGADVAGPDVVAGDTILGYLPTRLSSGGTLAVYCDGSVRELSQQQFDAAPKAKPRPEKKTDPVNDAKW
jgi:hypothetical protein